MSLLSFCGAIWFTGIEMVFLLPERSLVVARYDCSDAPGYRCAPSAEPLVVVEDARGALVLMNRQRAVDDDVRAAAEWLVYRAERGLRPAVHELA